MGFLTDPGAGRSKLTFLLENNHGKLCVLLYVAGIIWFALLAHEHFNAATYFSENALLPGLVESEYDEDHTAKKLLEELTDESSRYPESLPYSWLLAKFRQIGLETYTHNFTLNYPLGYGATYHGKNVYAILRAPRAASTEAVVLSAPYRPPSRLHPSTYPGIALLLSLAKYFRRQKYWAKDLVFLITEHEQLGAQAWLEAYHQASCGQPGVLAHGDLPARSGSIQAAVNLELRSSRISHIDVKVEGLNGQLPNLDLVNLVHRLCAVESVRHTFKNRENPNYVNPWREWYHYLRTLLAMVFTQATGMTNGNHGLFHRFGIEAVTLEGFERRTSGGAPMFYQMGRVLEGVCRSLNNLLERFHQSFFFYLLPSTDRYISIGTYMPSLGMMCGALLIRAFALWLRMHEEAPALEDEAKNKQPAGEDAEEKSNSEAMETKDEPAQTGGTKQEKEEADNAVEKVRDASACAGPVLVVVGAAVLAAHAAGVLVVNAPTPVSRYGVSLLGLTTVDSMWYGAVAGSVFLVIIASFISRLLARSPEVGVLLNIAALLELSTLLLALSMQNFSLALVCGTFYTPLALAMGAFHRRWLRGLVWVLWLLLHPLTLLSLAVLGSAKINFPDESPSDILERMNYGSRQALLLAVLDSQVYGSWAFNVITGTLLPTWLLFWMAG